MFVLVLAHIVLTANPIPSIRTLWRPGLGQTVGIVAFHYGGSRFESFNGPSNPSLLSPLLRVVPLLTVYIFISPTNEVSGERQNEKMVNVGE